MPQDEFADHTPDPAEHKPKQRRALSHVGGAIVLSGGSEEERVALSHALEVDADEAATMAHVHGFHSYPARLHPQTASRLIRGFSKADATLLDPFCGSGTVLVEARLLGRKAYGVDANPLAIELALLKCHGISSDSANALQDAAKAVAAHADERRLKKLGPTRRYEAADRELYDAHVLLELDGLRDGVLRLESSEIRRALWLVLSATLTKVSRRRGDSAAGKAPKRLAGGFTIRFFVSKTEELARRLLDYAARLPARAPHIKCAAGDARSLVQVRTAEIDLIVSSPPYPGVYDYFEHHLPRLRFLGFDEDSFERSEIGSRRRLSKIGFDAAVERWRHEFGACLDEFRRVLAPAGTIALVIADSVLGGRALHADHLLKELAARHGLGLVASASQKRPYFHEPTRAAFRERDRLEHVLLLRHKTNDPSSRRKIVTRGHKR
ncbi:MAG TPA: DNA methyltransferase [Polyangiaceae bacterium]